MSRAPWRALAPGLLLALACALPSAGCGDGSRAAERVPVLSVFAASSLIDVFAELEETFESAHPSVDVRVSTAGSQALRLQIEHGAPADVFASANPDHMGALVRAGHVRKSVVFARNELVVAVPEDDAPDIRTLADLPRSSRLVVGAPEVPLGRYTERFLDRAGTILGAHFVAEVEANVVSLEPNARLVLAKVELGEADAAIVYSTDAVAGRGIRRIPIPPRLNVRAEYHIGALASAPQPSLASAWVSLVHSEDGRAALARHGFGVE